MLNLNTYIMKTRLNLLYVLPFFALFMLASCQEEAVEITEPNTQETFVAESDLAMLIAQTSTNDGSSDNIIDGANGFSVNLPVTVYANGVEITVNSEADFELIEEIFDASDDDDDTLEIVFPITVTMRDYTQVVVNSQAELDDLRSHNSNEDDDDIECVDFKYPITISIYNLNFQVIDVVTINSDEQLHHFIRNLEGGVLASLNFPVTMVYEDGSTIEVHNNTELENVMKEARNACDEDDDNDWNDDDFTKERLDHLLTSCPWIVHDIRRNDNNLTDEYREYVMVFKEDGVVKVRARNGDMLTGTWSTRITDHGAKITLEFDTLVDFTLEWFVYEISEGKIKLFTEGGNRIILEKACDIVVDQTIERIENILKECLWRVERLYVDGTENEADYIGTPLKFFSEGVVKIRVNGEFVSGTWDVFAVNAGYALKIQLEGRPHLQLQWLITFLEPHLIKLENQNSIMVLKQHCPDGDEDVMYINAILNEGIWDIAKYEVGDQNLTEQFHMYGIDFLETGGLKVLNPNNTIIDYGAWLVYRNEGLFLGLNFGTDSTFSLFNHRWKIASVSETRIELKDYSSTGTVERILVLERR
jgi:hypothetical protein